MKIFGNYQVQTVGSDTIMNLGSDAEGDLYYTDANGKMARLAAPPSAGDWVLHHTGTAPVWIEETDFSTLTVTSADGTEYGDTLIGVSPGTGTLLYKVGATVDTPLYNEVVTGYTAITPPDDITATTGQYITVVEVDDEGRAFAKGSVVINSNDVKASIAELAKITDVGVETVPDITLNTKSAVETELPILADALIGAGFTATIEAGSAYDAATRVWTGKFTVTSDTTPTDTTTDAANRTLDIIPTTALGSATELAKITDVGIKTVPALTENTKVAVEAAMLTLAAALDGAGYTPTIESSTYDTDTKEWVGKIRETNDTIPLDFTIDAANRTFTVLWAE